MIRPITIVTFLMACGSGLYLYQSKHEVQLLDRAIEKTLHDTGAMREQSRLLATEWNMLNDPERLRQFSDTYLNLKSIAPAQYTSLNDLGSKLPAPLIETPAPVEAPAEVSSAAPVIGDSAPQALVEPEAAAAALGDVLPVPPIPTVRPALAVTPAARPIEARVALSRPALVAPVVSDVRPSEVRASDVRPSEVRASEVRASEVRASEVRASEVRPGESRQVDVRPAEPKALPRVAEARGEVRVQTTPPPRPIVLAAPRPQPVYSQPAPVAVSAPGSAPAPAPFRQAVPVSPAPASPIPASSAPASASTRYSGSLLGMARGSMPPAPRPLPVNTTYNAN